MRPQMEKSSIKLEKSALFFKNDIGKEDVQNRHLKQFKENFIKSFAHSVRSI